MPHFGHRSLANLATCDERLQRVMHRAIQVFDFSVVCGHRDQAAQDAAHADGRSKKRWPDSRHNEFPSMAVDVAPWSNGIDWYDHLAFARLYGIIEACAHAEGVALVWGGDWDSDEESNDQSFMDLTHVQLDI